MSDAVEPLLPPELAIDEPPVSDEEFDSWVEHEANVQEELGVSEDADHWVASMPEGMQEIANTDFDFERAEWMMAKLAAVRAEQDEDQAHLTEYQARLERWFERRTRRRTVAGQFLSGGLENMLRRAHEADPKVKSIDLPSGKITSSGPSKGNEDVVEFDGAAGKEQVVDWAVANERLDMVQVEYRALITDIRAAVILATNEDGSQVVTAATHPDGELVPVPGLSVRHKERTFKAKPGG